MLSMWMCWADRVALRRAAQPICACVTHVEDAHGNGARGVVYAASAYKH